MQLLGISAILDKVDKGVFFEVLLLCHTGMPPLVVAHSTATTEIFLTKLELAMTSKLRSGNIPSTPGFNDFGVV